MIFEGLSGQGGGKFPQIKKAIKSFLYQDQFEKTEEMVIYRLSNYGGLLFCKIRLF